MSKDTRDRGATYLNLVGLFVAQRGARPTDQCGVREMRQ